VCARLSGAHFSGDFRQFYGFGRFGYLIFLAANFHLRYRLSLLHIIYTQGILRCAIFTLQHTQQCLTIQRTNLAPFAISIVFPHHPFDFCFIDFVCQDTPIGAAFGHAFGVDPQQRL
jgi:hypothetical protein